MLSTNRNLVYIWVICFIIVVAAAAVKFHSWIPGSSDSDSHTATTTSLATDQSFYTGTKPNVAASVTPKPKPTAPAVPADPVTAKAYLVGDVTTGKIYLQKNHSTAMPVASMSKLITAITVLDTLPLNTKITITEADLRVASDTSWLQAGEQFTAEELLYPLLLPSSNIAAEALASAGPRARFMELMTGYAWEVNMPSAFFADPSGLSPRNAASAVDLFALARYLYTAHPDILRITRIARAAAATTTEHNSHTFVNTHPFVTDPRFLGGKTGRTPEAGETMMTIMNIKDHPIAIIVLGSVSGGRAGDTKLLIERVEKLVK